MEMKIGFIGLGITGGRMAANLQKHGYSLVVFNRTRAKAEPLHPRCRKCDRGFVRASSLRPKPRGDLVE